MRERQKEAKKVIGVLKMLAAFYERCVMSITGGLFDLNEIPNGSGYGRWFWLQPFGELNRGINDE